MYKDYLLVITCDFSRKVELIYTTSANIQTTVNALLWWKARYGFADDFRISTDNGSHFSGKLLKELSGKLKFKHRFAVVYSPWTNGSAESSNVPVIEITRQLLSEYFLVEEDWPSILPLVQCHINHLKNRDTQLSPNDLFIGINHNEENIIHSEKYCQHSEEMYPVVCKGKLCYPKDIDKLKEHLIALGEALSKCWQRAYDIKRKLREDRNRNFNKRFKLSSVQYSPGEYVLMSTQGSFKGRNKVLLKWIGPMQIISIEGHNVYKLRDPIGSDYVIHSSRLRFHDGKDFKPDDLVRQQYLNDRGRFYVEKVLNLRHEKSQLYLEVKWLGIEETSRKLVGDFIVLQLT
jgi:hypothetical protein